MEDLSRSRAELLAALMLAERQIRKLRKKKSKKEADLDEK
jgi:hypothetical protein